MTIKLEPCLLNQPHTSLTCRRSNEEDLFECITNSYQ